MKILNLLQVEYYVCKQSCETPSQSAYRAITVAITAVNIGLHAQHRTSINDRLSTCNGRVVISTVTDRLHGAANGDAGRLSQADNSGNDRRRTPAMDISEPSTQRATKTT